MSAPSYVVPAAPGFEVLIFAKCDGYAACFPVIAWHIYRDPFESDEILDAAPITPFGDVDLRELYYAWRGPNGGPWIGPWWADQKFETADDFNAYCRLREEAIAASNGEAEKLKAAKQRAVDQVGHS